MTVRGQGTLFHFDGTSGFIPQLVQTPNRKGDDGFPKKGSYFFFPILARARDGETVCLSNGKKGERGDQRGSIKLKHTQWIRKRSNFSSDHVAHFYSPSPPSPISNRPLPISTLATPVRQQSTWNFSAWSRVRKGNFPRDNDQSPSRGIHSEEEDEIKREGKKANRVRKSGKRRNRAFGKKARRSPLAPPVHGVQRRGETYNAATAAAIVSRRRAHARMRETHRVEAR